MAMQEKKHQMTLAEENQQRERERVQEQAPTYSIEGMYED